MKEETGEYDIADLMLAARCWCDPETENVEMDDRLARAFAKRIHTLRTQVEASREDAIQAHEARFKMEAEHKGPGKFATWKDAAIDLQIKYSIVIAELQKK